MKIVYEYFQWEPGIRYSSTGIKTDTLENSSEQLPTARLQWYLADSIVIQNNLAGLGIM